MVYNILFINGCGLMSWVEQRPGICISMFFFILVESAMALRMFFLLLTYTYVIARNEQQYVSKPKTHIGQGF